MEASITFKSVGKTIKNKILLADLSFVVEKGSTFVLIGKNGAGKSTILRLLVGLIEKDVGSVYIQGKDISTRSSETRSLCGYMSQDNTLDDELKVIENLAIFLRKNLQIIDISLDQDFNKKKDEHLDEQIEKLQFLQ